MRLNLSEEGQLSIPQRMLLNDIAERTRKPFNDIIGQLTIGHNSNLDWWVSEIASRNTYTNDLFNDCCYAIFVSELLGQSEDIKEILVSSLPLSKVLRKFCQKHQLQVRIFYNGGWLRSLKKILRVGVIMAQCRLILKLLYIYFVCRCSKSVSLKITAPITLIDVFVNDTSFNHERFQDRYYPGILNYLTVTEKPRFFYLPTFQISWRNVKKIIALCRRNPNFLLKEDYLTICDYFYALLYPLRALRLYPSQVALSGVDITPLFRSVWIDNLVSANSIEALLKYRFVRRLKETNILIRLVIDWFENQIIDKGANAGFRHYYPETPLIGYQGFIVPKYYLCMYPTSNELNSQVIPKIIAVCGHGLIESRKEFCADLTVINGPGFRFSGVWQDRLKNPDSNHYTILVSLPLEEGWKDIIRIVVSVSNKPLPQKTRFLVKPHPSAKPIEPQLKTLNLALPDCAQFIHGEFNDVVELADLMISNTSSTGLEAMAKGVPVIIIGNQIGITQNPIPENLNTNMWRLCYSPEEVSEAIQFFSNSDHKDHSIQSEECAKIRELYFNPVNRETVRKFLLLDRDF